MKESNKKMRNNTNLKAVISGLVFHLILYQLKSVKIVVFILEEALELFFWMKYCRVLKNEVFGGILQQGTQWTVLIFPFIAEQWNTHLVNKNFFIQNLLTTMQAGKAYKLKSEEKRSGIYTKERKYWLSCKKYLFWIKM